IMGEGDDRAGLERVLRVRGTGAVAGLAGGGGRIGGEGDLHAQRVRGVGEVLVFLAVAGGADLLPDGAGVGRLRIVRHGRIGEAGSDVEGVHRLRILAAEMRGREVVGIGGGGAFL